MQEYTTEVTALTYLTADVVELEVRLISPDTINYQAGQYMFFEVGDTGGPKTADNPAGRELRCYSMVTPPIGNNPTLRFLIKLEPQGHGSKFIKALTPGKQIKMMGPTGGFSVPDLEHNLFFVAAGIGVAPFASMVPDLLARGFNGRLMLLFGLHNEESVFYFHKFNELLPLHPNFTFLPILSHPESHWPGEVGRVTTYINVSYPTFDDSVFYLCGSPEMVKDCRTILLEKGHAAKNIKTEIFT